MKYLRRMFLIAMCVMLMGVVTACGNGDNAANPDANTSGTSQNGTVNDATNGENAAGNTGTENGGAAGDIIDDVGDGVEDAVDGVEDGVDDMTDNGNGTNNRNVNDNHTIDGQE